MHRQSFRSEHQNPRSINPRLSFPRRWSRPSPIAISRHLGNRAVFTSRFFGLLLFFACVFSVYENPVGPLGPQQAQAAQAKTPDLVVNSLSNPPASAVVGGNFSVTDTTANTGTVSAAASTTRYRLSLDATI